jgi:glycine cleavage system H protein
MSTPVELRLLKTHEWARQEGSTVVVGVSEYAIEQLNRELVFLELPEVGRVVKQGGPFGVLEAVKAASDLYAPVSGTVVAVNGAAAEDPMVVANAPFTDGWMVKIEMSDPSELDKLVPGGEYQRLVDAGELH